MTMADRDSFTRMFGGLSTQREYARDTQSANRLQGHIVKVDLPETEARIGTVDHPLPSSIHQLIANIIAGLRPHD